MQAVFEKIIEKLNSKKAYFQRFYECEGKSEHDADLNKSTQLAFDDAIEIVKQCGAADDVCEWIKYDYRTIFPKNHDANNPYWRIPDNTDKLKYCPYCGKKIKVVD